MLQKQKEVTMPFLEKVKEAGKMYTLNMELSIDMIEELKNL